MSQITLAPMGANGSVPCALMAEQPDKRKRRRRHEAPTLSLFAWALDREREGELVGADR